jgi:hypothetical protein
MVVPSVHEQGKVKYSRKKNERKGKGTLEVRTLFLFFLIFRCQLLETTQSLHELHRSHIFFVLFYIF